MDFFSIGTNDLASEVLGLDRADPGTGPPWPPIRGSCVSSTRWSRPPRPAASASSVCGDAAADPLVLPLLLGLGIRTLSVGAARVPQVARQIAGTEVARL